MSAEKPLTGMTAREWLINGRGGFEDGEDGIRACTMSAEAAIELMDEFTASLREEIAALKEELQNVLDDWNAVREASGSPTNGGLLGHVTQMKAEIAALRGQLDEVEDKRFDELFAKIELQTHQLLDKNGVPKMFISMSGKEDCGTRFDRLLKEVFGMEWKDEPKLQRRRRSNG